MVEQAPDELLDSLYLNEAGEVKAFPQHAARGQIQEARLNGRGAFPHWPAVFDELRIPYTTVVWTPIRNFPAGVQKALAALYREREAARELAFALYWQLLFGERWDYLSDHDVIKRARQHDWIRDHERPEPPPND